MKRYYGLSSMANNNISCSEWTGGTTSRWDRECSTSSRFVHAIHHLINVLPRLLNLPPVEGKFLKNIHWSSATTCDVRVLLVSCSYIADIWVLELLILRVINLITITECFLLCRKNRYW